MKISVNPLIGPVKSNQKKKNEKETPENMQRKNELN